MAELMPISARHRQMFMDSFEGSVRSLEPVQHSGDGQHFYYKCPCGNQRVPHYATRAIEDYESSQSPAQVLHCWESGKQWYINTDAARVILDEEIKFGKLMDAAEKGGLLGKRVSAAEAFRLHSERGICVELLDCDDLQEFDRLMDEHRVVSGGR